MITCTGNNAEKYGMKDVIIKGIVGLRRYWKFTVLIEILRVLEFIYVLVLVMEYTHIERCYCLMDDEREFGATHNDTFTKRKDLHAECEVLMIFLMIYILCRRILICCLQKVNSYGSNKLWVQMYVKEEEIYIDDDDDF